jgi:hypothetical protein
MLRAVRFAATYEFEIDPDTLRAIQDMAAEVTTVSAERIGVEVRRMLLDARRAVALTLLRESKLLPHVFAEVATLDDASFKELKRRLSAMSDPTLALTLAALLCNDLSADSSANAATAEAARVRSAQSLGRRLRFTNKEIERTAWLLRNIATIADAPQLPWPMLQRLLVHEGAAELVALREAVAGKNDPAVTYCRERIAWPAERLNPSPLLDGGDLIAHGLSPGPDFAPLLEKIRDAQLLDHISTREEALAFVDRLR